MKSANCCTVTFVVTKMWVYIPIFELLVALLLARLISSVTVELVEVLKIKSPMCYTDSMVR